MKLRRKIKEERGETHNWKGKEGDREGGEKEACE